LDYNSFHVTFLASKWQTFTFAAQLPSQVRNTKTDVLSNRRTQAGYFNWSSNWTLVLIIPVITLLLTSNNGWLTWL